MKGYQVDSNAVASGNKLISTFSRGTATTQFDGPTGVYDIVLNALSVSGETAEHRIEGVEIKANETTTINHNFKRKLQRYWI